MSQDYFCSAALWVTLPKKRPENRGLLGGRTMQRLTKWRVYLWVYFSPCKCFLGRVWACTGKRSVVPCHYELVQGARWLEFCKDLVEPADSS
jgi:hypothetical protein